MCLIEDDKRKLETVTSLLKEFLPTVRKRELMAFFLAPLLFRFWVNTSVGGRLGFLGLSVVFLVVLVSVLVAILVRGNHNKKVLLNLEQKAVELKSRREFLQLINDRKVSSVVDSSTKNGIFWPQSALIVGFVDGIEKPILIQTGSPFFRLSLINDCKRAGVTIISPRGEVAFESKLRMDPWTENPGSLN